MKILSVKIVLLVIASLGLSTSFSANAVKVARPKCLCSLERVSNKHHKCFGVGEGYTPVATQDECTKKCEELYKPSGFTVKQAYFGNDLDELRKQCKSETATTK